MASITISQLDETTVERLRARAIEHGRTVEEAGEIVKGAVAIRAPQPDNLYDAIRRIVEPLGGLEFPDFIREPANREPPTFE